LFESKSIPIFASDWNALISGSSGTYTVAYLDVRKKLQTADVFPVALGADTMVNKLVSTDIVNLSITCERGKKKAIGDIPLYPLEQ
jgi:hypothetical protein